MLILLQGKSVPALPALCQLPGTCGTVVAPGALGESLGHVGLGGWGGVSPPWLGCSALCASSSCCRGGLWGCDGSDGSLVLGGTWAVSPHLCHPQCDSSKVWCVV